MGDEGGNVVLLDGANGTLVMEINIGSSVTTLAIFSDTDSTYVACGSDGSEESHCTSNIHSVLFSVVFC
jgi:hypothetical protein